MVFSGQSIRNRRLPHANAGSDLVVRFVTSREVFLEFAHCCDRIEVRSFHESVPIERSFGIQVLPPVGVRRRARGLGIYAVELTAPGFLGSLALRITWGSVSNPHERVRRLSYYDPCSR